MRMKSKYTTIAAAAFMLAGMSSCTYKEAIHPDKMDVRISFNSPVASMPWAKAVTDKEIGAEYDKNESFAVWAVMDNGGTRSYYMGNASSGVKCSYRATEPEGWYPDDEWYWPVASTLDFRALSPADAGGTPTFGLDGKFILKDFQVPVAGSQYDLMVSDLSKGWLGVDFGAVDNDDNSIYKYKGVDLLFRHALCQVEFRGRLASGETSSEVFVTEVKLLGLDDIGTLAFQDDEMIDDRNRIVWSDAKSSSVTAKVEYGVFKNDSGTQLEYNSDGSSTSLKDHTLMLLPQVLSRGTAETDKVRVSIKYTKGGTAETEVRTLGGLLGTEGGVGVPVAVNNWLPGRKYVYTFVIGEDQMFFDPTVIDFKDWAGNIEVE